MFYLILGIMLVLFYIFAAPQNIKGTMNLVASVFLLVALVIALLLGFLRILKSPPEIWLCLTMILLGLWALRDLYLMPRSSRSKKK
ncbi:DUF3165 family protein [Streptococcus ovis]|uniref:DUF3165 family protein n=1 Tax=Streptococcus ovis TaxID=82806 RepID=UPI000368F856|nr:DUF3165 family protein [Streptococcus ovis]